MSYATLPAHDVVDMCRSASRAIERFRDRLCDLSVEREAKSRMKQWMRRTISLDQALAQVKADASFMRSFDMQLNRIHAHRSYDAILDLGYAAKLLMDGYRDDYPLNVTVEHLAALQVWKDKS